MRAFFTRRADLHDPAVLAEVAAEIGLDPVAANAMLESGERAESVRQKETLWTARGITGVPAMAFAGRHLVTGAQGEDSYGRILEQLAKKAA